VVSASAAVCSVRLVFAFCGSRPSHLLVAVPPSGTRPRSVPWWLHRLRPPPDPPRAASSLSCPPPFAVRPGGCAWVVGSVRSALRPAVRPASAWSAAPLPPVGPRRCSRPSVPAVRALPAHPPAGRPSPPVPSASPRRVPSCLSGALLCFMPCPPPCSCGCLVQSQSKFHHFILSEGVEPAGTHWRQSR
jgi:hypothetical protein